MAIDLKALTERFRALGFADEQIAAILKDEEARVLQLLALEEALEATQQNRSSEQIARWYRIMGVVPALRWRDEPPRVEEVPEGGSAFFWFQASHQGTLEPPTVVEVSAVSGSPLIERIGSSSASQRWAPGRWCPIPEPEE